MKHSRLVLGLCALAALASLLIAQPAGAAIITSTANLPPPGVYLTPDAVHANYGGAALTVLLARPEHAPFEQEAQRRDGGDADGDGVHDEEEQFPSSLQGDATVLQNGVPIFSGPVGATGPVTTVVFNKLGQTTGTFDTEMLAMTMTGTSPLGPFMIRESPTLRSTGQTSIQALPGGNFRIDSFFDVFTELSIDGGATWMPDNTGPVRVELVPEPGTMTLLGLGAAVLAGLGWRRRRAA
jgi:hypothetical protein